MSEKEEKIYTGHFKAVETRYGTLLNGFLDLDVLNQHSKKLGETNIANITILQRREDSPKGMTHYAIVDKYEPKQKEPDNTTECEEQDIPF